MTQGRVAPDYLTAAEVAEQLGVSRQTVYRWINDHRLEAQVFNDGRLLRVSSEAVEAFLTGTRRAAVTHNGRA